MEKSTSIIRPPGVKRVKSERFREQKSSEMRVIIAEGLEERRKQSASMLSALTGLTDIFLMSVMPERPQKTLMLMHALS